VGKDPDINDSRQNCSILGGHSSLSGDTAFFVPTLGSLAFLKKFFPPSNENENHPIMNPFKHKSSKFGVFNLAPVIFLSILNII